MSDGLPVLSTDVARRKFRPDRFHRPMDFPASKVAHSAASFVELGADRLIADETLAREEAKRSNVSVIGTLGVLRNAARANLLALPEVLSKLQQTNFYVAPEIDSVAS